MANPVDVRLTGAWSSFISAVDPKQVQGRLRTQMTIANKRIGRQFVAVAQRMIRAETYAPNSPLTQILKGSSKPLVDRGDLMQGITFQVKAWDDLRVGLIRQRSGEDTVNLGIILHEGATIDTNKHPRVRRKVWAMVREALGASRMSALNARSRQTVRGAGGSLGTQGTSSSTGGIWVIPARPFILTPLNDPAFVKFVGNTWAEALEKALFPPGQKTS